LKIYEKFRNIGSLNTLFLFLLCAIQSVKWHCFLIKLCMSQIF